MKHLTVILMLVLVGLVRADYHYASHDGSNEYPYTSWETAALLIQDAVDAGNPHDTGIGFQMQFLVSWKLL